MKKIKLYIVIFLSAFFLISNNVQEFGKTDNVNAATKTNEQAKSWKNINNNWYFTDNNGNKQVGWTQFGSYWFFFDANGVMANGWKYLSGGWFHFDNGFMTTGWKKIGNSWYYFDANGWMKTEWQYLSGGWFYFGTNGAMRTHWQWMSGSWYYLDDSGFLQRGWRYMSGVWYHFEDGGSMSTSWRKINGSWYYFNNHGYMLKGWQYIYNNWYYLDNNGVWSNVKSYLFVMGHGYGDSGAIGSGTNEANFNRNELMPKLQYWTEKLPSNIKVDYYDPNRDMFYDTTKLHQGAWTVSNKYESVTMFHLDAGNHGGHVIVKPGDNSYINRELVSVVQKYVGLNPAYANGLSFRTDLKNNGALDKRGISERLIEMATITNPNDVRNLRNNLNNFTKEVVEAITGYRF